MFFVGFCPDAAAFAAVAAVGAAARYEFFAAETGCAITAFACGDFDFCFVDEFHGVLLYFGFQTTFCAEVV